MTTNGRKCGIIDIGGGLRGIYAAGVFDRCMDEGVYFDVAIGISAGSANVASYIAGQRGRNYRFYTEYSLRPEYMSIRNYARKRSYIDLDYVYSDLTNEGGENPLDYDAFEASPIDWRIEACDAVTGEAKYFDKSHIHRNSYDIFKASSAIPFVCQPIEIGNTLYFDGALGDTVPVEKAFEMGCERVVLVLTKPKGKLREVGNDARLSQLIRRKYPKAAERLLTRADRYNEGVALAKALEEDGLVLIIAPDDTCGVDTLTKDVKAMERLYEKGYRDAARIRPFLEK